MAQVSDEDIQRTANLLKAFEPGFLPYPIFEQIARLVALPIIEFVPIKRDESGNTQVLLTQRPADDPIWPGLWHTPGTVVRATDMHRGPESGWQAFARIAHEELQDTKIGAPHFVGNLFNTSKRGAEQTQLYWAEIIGQPRVGEFYDANNLPEGLIASQRAFILEAVKNFDEYVTDSSVTPRQDQKS